MRVFILNMVLLFLPLFSFGQQEEVKPAYCDELPVTYEKGGKVPPGGRPSLPRFATQPVTEYKVQVAILRQTHPKDFTFHPKLVARYRPCEQVWVVESRESFPEKKEAEKLRKELLGLGYRGAYITELIGYQ